MSNTQAPDSRSRVHEIIFEADTPAGKLFDLALLVLILVSVLAAVLESVPSVQQEYKHALRVLEWIVTILFTVEYGLRIWSVEKPWRYITSFLGVIDLLAILPTYLSLFLSGSQYFAVIRVIRLLRVFRILKMARYIAEAQTLSRALRASLPKVLVFIFSVVAIITIIGPIMYLIEGPEHGFTSIPVSMYWAVVTLTTVGYGDVSPATPAGQILASLLMIMGYGIIAVPTGIVTAELAQQGLTGKISTRACRHCSLEGHMSDAVFCKFCGAKL